MDNFQRVATGEINTATAPLQESETEVILEETQEVAEVEEETPSDDKEEAINEEAINKDTLDALIRTELGKNDNFIEQVKTTLLVVQEILHSYHLLVGKYQKGLEETAILRLEGKDNLDKVTSLHTDFLERKTALDENIAQFYAIYTPQKEELLELLEKVELQAQETQEDLTQDSAQREAIKTEFEDLLFMLRNIEEKEQELAHILSVSEEIKTGHIQAVEGARDEALKRIATSENIINSYVEVVRKDMEFIKEATMPPLVLEKENAFKEVELQALEKSNTIVKTQESITLLEEEIQELQTQKAQKEVLGEDTDAITAQITQKQQELESQKVVLKALEDELVEIEKDKLKKEKEYQDASIDIERKELATKEYTDAQDLALLEAIKEVDNKLPKDTTLKKLEKEVENATQLLGEKQQEKAQKEQELQEIQAQITQKEQSLQTQGQQELEALQQQKAQKEQELQALEEEITQKQSSGENVDALNAQKSQKEQELQEIQAQITQKEQSLQTQGQQELEALQQQKAQKEQELTEIDSAITNAQSDLAQKEEALKDATKNPKTPELATKEYTDAQDLALLEAIKEVDGKLPKSDVVVEKENALKQAQANLQEKQEQIQQTTQEISTLESEISSLEEELQDLDAQIEEKTLKGEDTQELQTLKTQKEQQLQEKQAQLQEKNASLERAKEELEPLNTQITEKQKELKESESAPSPELTKKSYTDELDAQNVKIQTAQSITGVKTFEALPLSAIAPTEDTHFTNKAYVDSIGNAKVALSGNQAIAGNKTFNGTTTLNATNIIGATTISGQATFSRVPICNPAPSADTHLVNRAYSKKRGGYVVLNNGAINFNNGINFRLNLGANTRITCSNQASNIGQTGEIYVPTGARITGFNAPFNFRIAQSGFGNNEVFSYTIIASNFVRITRS